MDKHRLGRPGLSTLVAMALVGVVACGGEDAGNAVPGDPVAVAGTTDQGLRVRLEPLDGRRVRVDVEADCFEDGERQSVARRDRFINRSSPDVPDDHELVAPVAEDGSFEIDDSYRVGSTDGVTGDVEMHIEGTFTSDGTATGTLDAHQVWHDPTVDEHFGECSTDTVGWRADEPPALATGDYVEIPLDGSFMLLSNGPDLLAIVENREAPDLPEVVTIDGSSTEVRERRPLAATGDLSAVLDQEMLASVAGGIWAVMGEYDRDTLMRTDLTSAQSTPVETGEVLALAGGLDALWTLSRATGPGEDISLEKRDPQSGQVMTSVRSTWGDLAIGPAELWHVDEDDDGSTVTRIDPMTLDTIESFSVDGRLVGSAGVVATANEVWMLSDERDRVVILDATTGDVTVVELPAPGSSLAVDEEGAWITHPRDDVIRRIEGGEITRTVDLPETLTNGARMTNIALTDDGAVWLAGEYQILRIDPATLGG